MSVYQELNDIELMEKISKYDSRAIEELYNRYSALLYTLIKKISNNEKLAEDILVKVFAIVWRKIDHFESAQGNVYGWLVALARNCAVDELRRSRSVVGKLDDYDDDYEDFFIIPEISSKTDKLDFETATRFKASVETALSRLTDAQKYVIHLAYYEGYNLEEIADKLNIPVETVRNKISTAIQNLKDQLST